MCQIRKRPNIHHLLGILSKRLTYKILHCWGSCGMVDLSIPFEVEMLYITGARVVLPRLECSHISYLCGSIKYAIHITCDNPSFASSNKLRF
jgi:hypothetical protein